MKDFDSTHTIELYFPDFLRLLEIVAVRVYPTGPSGKSCTIDVSLSLRRLLLENVLLLASRRSNTIETICNSNKDAEAEAVVLTLFAKPLMAVFKFYIDKADLRRSQELAEQGGTWVWMMWRT